MPNPQNIEGKAWKKGQCGNPKGRPLGTKGLTQTLKDILNSDGSIFIENVLEVDNNNIETGKVFLRAKVKIPKKDMIILAALKKSVKGDMRAVEFIFDRIEGKPKQSVQIEGKIFGDVEPEKLKQSVKELRDAANSD